MKDVRTCVNCSETIVKEVQDGEPFVHENTGNVACVTGGTDVATVWLDDGKPHLGHRARFTGAWYCDTCDSPYCDLL